MFLEWNEVEMLIFDIKDFIEFYFFMGFITLQKEEFNFVVFLFFCCGNNPIVNSGIVDICHDRFI